MTAKVADSPLCISDYTACYGEKLSLLPIQESFVEESVDQFTLESSRQFVERFTNSKTLSHNLRTRFKPSQTQNISSLLRTVTSESQQLALLLYVRESKGAFSVEELSLIAEVIREKYFVAPHPVIMQEAFVTYGTLVDLLDRQEVRKGANAIRNKVDEVEDPEFLSLLIFNYGELVFALNTSEIVRTLEILQSFFGHEDKYVRWSSIYLLGKISDKLPRRILNENVDFFFSLFSDSFNGNRWRVIEVVTNCFSRFSPKNRDKLCLEYKKLLFDSNFEVQLQASLCFGKISKFLSKDKVLEIAPLVREFFYDEEPEMVRQALLTYADIATSINADEAREGIDIIHKLFFHQDWYVREAAVKASIALLSQLDKTEKKSALRQIQMMADSDPSPDVRRVAWYYLNDS